MIARSGLNARTTLSSGQLERIRCLEDALLTIPCDDKEIAPITTEAIGAPHEPLGGRRRIRIRPAPGEAFESTRGELSPRSGWTVERAPPCTQA